jgi:integrase
MWIIPAHRMKAGKEHRVPLSPTAVMLLQSLIPTTPEGKQWHVVGHCFRA